MARLVFIGGRSGTGKSTSLMEVSPETTFILNSDAHELPFPYKDRFNREAGNYLEGSDIGTLKTVFRTVQDDKRFKVLVIDTWSRVMTDYIMAKPFRAAPDGRKAWGKFAQDMYDLLDTINTILRKDLTVVVFCHTEQYFTDSGIQLEKISVQGQQLSKFVPESFSTMVLYTQVEALPGQKPKYYFRTETSGYDTCKTPIGMFKESLIPNDLNIVLDSISKYYS